MSDGDDRMLRIRYSGRRFSGHAIPLGMMDDLKAVNDMVLDVASRIYKETHGTNRVPKRFREDHGLSLVSVSEGSAVAHITPHRALGQQMVTDSDLCVDEAIAEMITFLDGGESRHADLIRPRLRSMGPRLGEDEYMEFTYRESSARYDQARRREFTAKGDAIELYGSMYGRVTEVDAENRTFKLSAVPDKGARRIDFQLSDVSGLDGGTSMDINHLLNRIVLVTGTFNEAQDGSRDVGSIDTMEVLDPLDVDYRLLELSSLEDGWGENGDEMAPDANRIRTLMDRYDRFATGLRLPRIFPTVEGNLEFEWDSDELSVLEVDLATMQGVLYTDDDECEVDLESSEGWATVISKVGADAVE